MQKALDIIQYTRNSLFVTGKAGTGKSTFLRYVAATTKKKHVILAPTGIAAINAGGTTIHSFFKMPFHPMLPNDTQYSVGKIRDTLKYSKEKIKIIRNLELIIIDEISMVRADVIDFIDKVLRVYSRNMREPFGGKQLLLFGDLYQLEPVLKEDERQLLSQFYPSKFFFDAKVFAEMPLVSIELTKVYRQNNAEFIAILDRIRNSTASMNDINRLNQRVGDATHNSQDGLSITLSTRRDTVDAINQSKLRQLPGDPITFYGEIEGDFPESSLPTPLELELKPGAQIIFVKNDKERRWVNGTLGTIIGLGDEHDRHIYIMTENNVEVDVEPDMWSNVKYVFNEKEQKIEEKEIGTYCQFPLRLAWAITVHKSQGLTFQNVNIDFTGGVFASGQTYVALSRCTSIEGIVLKEPLRLKDVFCNQDVINFSRHYNDNNRIKQVLQVSKADKAYDEANRAFCEGDMQEALDKLFFAIHCRYDLEKPTVKRLLRRKLNTINLLRQEIQDLKKQQEEKQKMLSNLAMEYVLMGKECEKEHMTEAAIKNYEKALVLNPELPQANRRLKILRKK